MPLVPSSIPQPDDSGVGTRRRSSATACTRKTRRKTVGGGAPSPPIGLGSSSSDDSDDAMLMDDDDDRSQQVQEAEQGGQGRREEEEEELVFPAESVLDDEELARCYQVLRSREHHIHPSFAARLDEDGVRKVAERFYRFRYRDLKREGVNLDDTTTDTVPMSEYPSEVLKWESPYKPGRGMFGWTFHPMYADFADLDDYQRMVPKRAALAEYPEWERYCSAFSNYETDKEYVQYWGELFKKIKWIEEYSHLDYKEFSTYKSRGASQAMKIAAGFCHLPASLATLGYNEYIDALEDSFDLLREDNGRLYLELWKRVTKQGMTFEDALQDILASDNKLPPPCLHRIKLTIMGYEYDILEHFLICEKHIVKHIADDDNDDTVLKHIITDALYTKIRRRKWYVDYAKTKLAVARRIRMLPAMKRMQNLYSTLLPAISSQQWD